MKNETLMQEYAKIGEQAHPRQADPVRCRGLNAAEELPRRICCSCTRCCSHSLFPFAELSLCIILIPLLSTPLSPPRNRRFVARVAWLTQRRRRPGDEGTGRRRPRTKFGRGSAGRCAAALLLLPAAVASESMCCAGACRRALLATLVSVSGQALR